MLSTNLLFGFVTYLKSMFLFIIKYNLEESWPNEIDNYKKSRKLLKL